MKKCQFLLPAVLILFSITVPLSGQSLRAYERAGHEAMELKNYYSAMKHFQVVLEVTPKRTDIWYDYANAARLFSSFSRAKAAYLIVLESKEAKDFPMLDFWLGIVRQRMGEFAEAKADFERFLKAGKVEDYYLQRAREEIASCQLALQIVGNENPDIEIRNLNDPVNTPSSEFGAFYKNDTLFYSSLQFDNPKQSENFEHPKYARVLIAPPYDQGEIWDVAYSQDTNSVAHTAFSLDGQRMYFNECEFINANDLRCKLRYRERLADGRWGPSRLLPKFINERQTTATQPSIGFDERTGKEVLFFASDRPEGKGKMDIWYAYIEKDGTINPPLNLESVNTIEDEATPFFHTPSQTLFFSSEGYKGLGGLDIFKTSREAGKWKTPEHLGYPINSSYNDLYYRLDERADKAMFSSNRLGSMFVDEALESCCFDIYEVEFVEIVTELVLSTYDRKGNVPLTGVTTELIDEVTGAVETYFEPNEAVKTIPLERERDYLIVNYHPGFYPDTISLSTMGIMRSTTIERDVYLEPVEELSLEVLTFDADSREPLPGVRVELLDPLSGTSDWQRRYADHIFQFPLPTAQNYQIFTLKEGYIPDTLDLNISLEELEDGKVSRMIFLSPKPSNILTLSEFLPIPLFFDNNQPKRGKKASHTYATYSEIFDDYFGRKETFIRMRL
jgi:tetratricopeptide (TPR) repeat protein